MTGGSRPALRLWLEWGLWVGLAAAAYWLTFDFDEPLGVYAFGASGWPRFILACILVGATLQLVVALVRRPAEDLPAPPEDGAGAAQPASPVSLRLLAIFGLPLVYLFLLPGAGFFVTTPLFVLAFLWILEVRRPPALIGVTAVVYGLVLLIFTRLFYVALPVGNWPGFYDANTWVVVAVRSLFAGG